MHYWNEKFGQMQEVKIANRQIFLLFFNRLSIWEKYKIFYDQSSDLFWIAQTTSIFYRVIMLILGVLLSLLYGLFILFMSIISLDIFHQDFWNSLKKDIDQYIQEVKELLFPEKYGQFYSIHISKASGNYYAVLKDQLKQ